MNRVGPCDPERTSRPRFVRPLGVSAGELAAIQARVFGLELEVQDPTAWWLEIDKRLENSHRLPDDEVEARALGREPAVHVFEIYMPVLEDRSSVGS